MSTARIEAFAFDDANEEKLWSHGVTTRELLQVLDGRFLVAPNRAGRGAPLLVIGRTESGRCLAAPIYPTEQEGVWRPVTGYPCNAWHEERLNRGKVR